MDAEQKTQAHSDLECRLRDASDEWSRQETADAAEAKELIDASIIFIEDQFELIAQLVDTSTSESDQRKFYAQVLAAISAYKGSDVTAMPLMALIAIADSLPAKEADGG